MQRAFFGFKAQLEQSKRQIDLGTPKCIAEANELDTEDDEDVDISNPLRRALCETPSKKRKADDGSPLPVPRRITLQTPSRRHGHPETHTTSNQPCRVPLTLDDVRAILAGEPSVASPLQDSQKLAKHLVSTWRQLVENFLDAHLCFLTEELQSIVSKTLSSRASTRLFREVSFVVATFIEELHAKERQRVLLLVDCEMHKPITYQTQSMSSIAGEVRARLKRLRHIKRVSEFYDTLHAKDMKGLPRDRARFKDEVLRSQLGPDDYSDEIDRLAVALAYYDIASSRMLDGIAGHLQFGVLNTLVTTLGKRLRNELKVADAQHCFELVADDQEHMGSRLE